MNRFTLALAVRWYLSGLPFVIMWELDILGCTFHVEGGIAKEMASQIWWKLV
jgi:hypothetical protein